MRFAHVAVLWLLLALPILGVFLALQARRGTAALARALGPRMALRLTAARSSHAQALRAGLLLLALACLVLAAARPQRGTHYVAAKRTGGDVLIALDVSASMLAEDLKPSRLERAQHEIAAILDRLRGDRVGLVAFAGAAFVQCPLTLDYGAARMFLDFMGPDLVPEPGTSLAQALRVSTHAFDAESEGYRALILITDGEDHVGDLEAATEEARRAGVRVFAVGIGSDRGEPIPEHDETGKVTGYRRDREGRVVMSRLNESALRQIAEETGGTYVGAGGELGLDRIVDAIDRMEKRELAGGIRVLYEERYRYFLWPALILLIAELWVPRQRGGLRHLTTATLRRARGLRLPMGGRTALLLLALPALAFAPGARAQNPPAPAPRVSAGPPGAQPAGESPEWSERLAENEVFREKHPGDPRPLYNLGNLYFEKGDFQRAEEFYQTAVPRWLSEPGTRAAYNLGNTLFKENQFTEARDAFLEALRRDPSNEEAKQNLELAQRMLDERQSAPDSSASQQNQQQDQQQDQKQQDQKQQDRKQQDQQQQDQQQNQPQGQQPQDQEQRQPQGDEQQQSGEKEEQQPQPDQPEGSQPPPAASEERSSEERVPLDQLQQMQILRGLESEERELLKHRFEAHARKLAVEKDW
jgi:Ca-activated chloride channel family protein